MRWKTDERERHLEAHKAYLRRADIRILQSGPFTSARGTGALIAAVVHGLGAVQSFSDADPFVVHEVYREIDILEWTVTLSAGSNL